VKRRAWARALDSAPISFPWQLVRRGEACYTPMASVRTPSQGASWGLEVGAGRYWPPK
jgi:hypothetical protein